MRVVAAFAAVVLASGTFAGVARAQTEDDKAAAQTLFDDGMRLFNAGKIDEACPKFAASLKHYPGLGTRGKLAECYEKQGKVASAWAMWREVAVVAHQATDTKREQIGNEKAKALEPRIPHLTIVVDPASPQPWPTVTRNGVPVDTAAFGTAIAVDPGSIQIDATAAGRVPFARTVTIGEKESKTVTVPPLDKAAVVDKGPPRVEDNHNPPPGEEPQVDHKGRRIAGITMVIAGGASVLVGGFFGIQAKSNWDDAFAAGGGCTKGMNGGPDTCTMAGQTKTDSARNDANMANIFVGAGAAIAVTGVVLWVISPSVVESPQATGFHFTPTVGPTQIGAAFTGTF
jgi:hypothetical protein